MANGFAFNPSRHKLVINDVPGFFTPYFVSSNCSAVSSWLSPSFLDSTALEQNILNSSIYSAGDTSASNLPWTTRWYTAIEIGCSLRYLHEECPDGPIVHQSVCSTTIVYSYGYSAMLSNFIAAKSLKDVPRDGEPTVKRPNLEKDKCLSVDLHDYGMFLVELITGKITNRFPHESEGQSVIDWALPLLESGSLNQMMDPRLTDEDDDSRVVQYMARAALLCLKNDLGHRLSISEVLAVVRGKQIAVL
ncbi:receptor-like cytosolic serine/threonine-protein kinase RBK1 [Herrania umbratica]|uniref:Receptor-like cytosolic serine/threonine-protein kinase RBK1 n=1 Tax=Herrania umbratica TaxID=108875 RepID=A0A6J1AHN3_9ROSI|nr:receptor-like cytosolic serine/threonine-protein kinase RBK1 [Herrania umbratica]